MLSVITFIGHNLLWQLDEVSYRQLAKLRKRSARTHPHIGRERLLTERSSQHQLQIACIKGSEPMKLAALHFLLKKNFAIDQVLRTRTWKLCFIFTAFYLWDLTHKSIDTFSLGLLVMAQQVIYIMLMH